MNTPKELSTKPLIKLFILDVDGVLTNGQIWYDEKGEEYKAFHVLDGLGLKRLNNAGIQIAVISGRKSPSVIQRMKELDITNVYQGITDKPLIFRKLLKKMHISAKQVAYIGDDLPDLPIMQQCGLSITVPNAVPEVKKVADHCTYQAGGYGAVREACEWILALLKKI